MGQKALLEEVQGLLDSKKDVPKEKVEQLISPDVKDDDVMVCVDLSDMPTVDAENVIDSLGVPKAAALFTEGRAKFLANLASLPEEDRKNMRQEMSGAEYQEMLEEEANVYRLMMGEGEEGE